MIYKFVKHDIAPLETHQNCFCYKLHSKLMEAKSLGQKPELTQEEKDFLCFTGHDLVYKLMGWAYDYREFLNLYWVDTKDYGIVKVYAWNKTSIRNSDNIWGILRIVEVENKHKEVAECR